MGALSNLLVGLILFSMMIAGYSIFIEEMNTNYEDMDTSSSEFRATYDKISEISDTSKDVSTVINQSEGFDDDSQQGIIKGTWSVVKIAYKSVSLPGDIIDDSTREFGLSQESSQTNFKWFGTAITAIIVITVIFAIAGSVLRGDL